MEDEKTLNENIENIETNGEKDTKENVKYELMVIDTNAGIDAKININADNGTKDTEREIETNGTDSTEEIDKNTNKKNINNTENDTKKGYGNNGNLIANKDRTPSELREMTKNGGIASGVARRQKKAIKSAIKTLLDMEPTTKEMELIKENGMAEYEELTKNEIVAIVLYQTAIKGDMRAIEKLIEIQDEITQKEESKTTDIIGALNLTAKEVWSDSSGDNESIETKDTKEVEETESTEDLKGGEDNAT